MSCLRCIVVSLAGGLLLGVTACTPVVVSQRVFLKNPDTAKSPYGTGLTNDHKGVIYFLPKNLLKLTVEIGGFEKPAATNGEDKKNDSGKNGATASATATASPTVNPIINVNGGQTSDNKNGTSANGGDTKTPTAASWAEVEALLQKNEENRLKPLPDSIVLKVMDAMPDLNQVYVAKLNHHRLRSDDFAIETTKEGLLKSVTLSSKEETPQVIVKLSEIAVQIARLAAAFGGAPINALGVRGELPKKPEDRLELYKKLTERRRFEIVFDPNDEKREDQLKLFAAQIHAFSGIGYQFILKPNADLINQDAEKYVWTIEGVFYRRPKTYQFELQKDGDSVYADSLTMPNGGPIAGCMMDTHLFVTTTYNLAFDNGCLLKNAENHPSEVLGFISVIPEALKNIASIPGEMLQVKVDYSNKNEKLLQSQQNQIDLQNKIIDLQKKQEALLQQNQATTNPSAQSGK